MQLLPWMTQVISKAKFSHFLAVHHRNKPATSPCGSWICSIYSTHKIHYFKVLSQSFVWIQNRNIFYAQMLETAELTERVGKKETNVYLMCAMCHTINITILRGSFFSSTCRRGNILREGIKWVQSHTASRWQRRVLGPWIFYLKALIISATAHHTV